MAQWSKYNIVIREDKSHVLFFNTRTGALVRLNPERQNQIKKVSTLSRDFLNFLLQQGFLIGDDVNELELISNVHESARKKQDRFSVTIELTEACNFKCLYCYQTHASNHMQSQVNEKVIRYLSKKMKTVSHLHVNWFGGEPLIQLKSLEAMSRQLKTEALACGCSFSQFLTTNGYLITPSIAKKLAVIGIESVQITLDGDEKSHNRLRVHQSGKGTYRRVLAACKYVIDAGMELLVRINVNRWNAQHIECFLLDLASCGISGKNTIIHATRAVNHGNCNTEMSSAFYSTKEFAQEFIDILQLIDRYAFNIPTLAPIAYNCPFDLQRTVMIGCDGGIRHCSSSNERIADLTDEGDEANYTKQYQVVKERRPMDDSSCRNCLCLPMCMGGCSYLQEIGEEKCIPEKYILPELVLLTARQARKTNMERR